MTSILTHSRNPTRLFLALGAVFACTHAPYAAIGSSPSGLVVLAARLWLGLAVVFWVTRDVRTTQFRPPFEYDFFMLLAWPVLLPHYLVKTRGRAGITLSVWFYLSLLAAVVLSAAVQVVGGHVVAK